MKKEIEDKVLERYPFTGHHNVTIKAETAKEAKKLGYWMSAGGEESVMIQISLDEIFKAMLKRFRIMYVPYIRDMIKNEPELLSTDEDLVAKMMEVAKECAKDIYREKLPKELAVAAQKQEK